MSSGQAWKENFKTILIAAFVASVVTGVPLAWFEKDSSSLLEQKVVVLDVDKIYSSVYRYLVNKGVSDEDAQKRAVEALKRVEKYAASLVHKGYLVLNGRTVVVAPKGMDKTAEILSDVLEKLDDAGYFTAKAN